MHEQYCVDLQQKGYTLVPQVYNESAIAQFKNKIAGEWGKVSRDARLNLNIPALNQGHQIIYNLQNKDVFFFQAFTKASLIHNILINCLNDEWYKQIPKGKANFILRSLLARSSGNSAMPLHIDSFIPNIGTHIAILQVAIILEDQTKENGCTVVVPGSHHFGRYATQDWIKNAIPIESKAGDVVIWDSRIWHGASANTTSKSRWAVIATFCRWWIKQNYDITGMIPVEYLKELSDEEKSILGFCSLPPRDEYDRLDIKTGYEIFQSQAAI